jgi:hypothetical protein
LEKLGELLETAAARSLRKGPMGAASRTRGRTGRSIVGISMRVSFDRQQRIGEDISRELEFTPAQLEVKVHVLPKYA